MKRHLLAVVLAPIALSGCLTPRPDLDAAAHHADAPPPPASTASETPEPIAPKAEPTIEVGAFEGVHPERALAHLEEARAHLRECAPGGSAVIRIDINAEGDRTTMHIDPASIEGVDSHTRQCVLEALSAIEPGDQLSQTSHINQASGFTGQFVISW